jgi:hypothetical protein
VEVEDFFAGQFVVLRKSNISSKRRRAVTALKRVTVAPNHPRIIVGGLIDEKPFIP